MQIHLFGNQYDDYDDADSSVWVSWLERLKGEREELKRPEEPPARSQVPKEPYTSSCINGSLMSWHISVKAQKMSILGLIGWE